MAKKITMELSDAQWRLLRKVSALSGQREATTIVEALGALEYLETARIRGDRILVLRPGGAMHEVTFHASHELGVE